jgi:hypothetical protein
VGLLHGATTMPETSGIRFVYLDMDSDIWIVIL